MSETFYMRISTHNIACSQRRRQMRAYITQLYIMSIQPANKAVKHLINSETREREGIGKDEFSSDDERERDLFLEGLQFRFSQKPI